MKKSLLMRFSSAFLAILMVLTTISWDGLSLVSHAEEDKDTTFEVYSVEKTEDFEQFESGLISQRDLEKTWSGSASSVDELKKLLGTTENAYIVVNKQVDLGEFEIPSNVRNITFDCDSMHEGTINIAGTDCPVYVIRDVEPEIYVAEGLSEDGNRIFYTVTKDKEKKIYTNPVLDESITEETFKKSKDYGRDGFMVSSPVFVRSFTFGKNANCNILIGEWTNFQLADGFDAVIFNTFDGFTGNVTLRNANLQVSLVAQSDIHLDVVGYNTVGGVNGFDADFYASSTLNVAGDNVVFHNVTAQKTREKLSEEEELISPLIIVDTKGKNYKDTDFKLISVSGATVESEYIKFLIEYVNTTFDDEKVGNMPLDGSPVLNLTTVGENAGAVAALFAYNNLNGVIIDSGLFYYEGSNPGGAENCFQMVALSEKHFKALKTAEDPMGYLNSLSDTEKNALVWKYGKSVSDLASELANDSKGANTEYVAVFTVDMYEDGYSEDLDLGSILTSLKEVAFYGNVRPFSMDSEWFRNDTAFLTATNANGETIFKEGKHYPILLVYFDTDGDGVTEEYDYIDSRALENYDGRGFLESYESEGSFLNGQNSAYSQKTLYEVKNLWCEDQTVDFSKVYSAEELMTIDGLGGAFYCRDELGVNVDEKIVFSNHLKEYDFSRSFLQAEHLSNIEVEANNSIDTDSVLVIREGANIDYTLAGAASNDNNLVIKACNTEFNNGLYNVKLGYYASTNEDFNGTVRNFVGFNDSNLSELNGIVVNDASIKTAVLNSYFTVDENSLNEWDAGKVKPVVLGDLSGVKVEKLVLDLGGISPYAANIEKGDKVADISGLNPNTKLVAAFGENMYFLDDKGCIIGETSPFNYSLSRDELYFDVKSANSTVLTVLDGFEDPEYISVNEVCNLENPWEDNAFIITRNPKKKNEFTLTLRESNGMVENVWDYDYRVVEVSIGDVRTLVRIKLNKFEPVIRTENEDYLQNPCIRVPEEESQEGYDEDGNWYYYGPWRDVTGEKYITTNFEEADRKLRIEFVGNLALPTIKVTDASAIATLEKKEDYYVLTIKENSKGVVKLECSADGITRTIIVRADKQGKFAGIHLENEDKLTYYMKGTEFYYSMGEDPVENNSIWCSDFFSVDDAYTYNDSYWFQPQILYSISGAGVEINDDYFALTGIGKSTLKATVDRAMNDYPVDAADPYLFVEQGLEGYWIKEQDYTYEDNGDEVYVNGEYKFVPLMYIEERCAWEKEVEIEIKPLWENEYKEAVYYHEVFDNSSATSEILLNSFSKDTVTLADVKWNPNVKIGDKEIGSWTWVYPDTVLEALDSKPVQSFEAVFVPTEEYADYPTLYANYELTIGEIVGIKLVDWYGWNYVAAYEGGITFEGQNDLYLYYIYPVYKGADFASDFKHAYVDYEGVHLEDAEQKLREMLPGTISYDKTSQKGITIQNSGMYPQLLKFCANKLKFTCTDTIVCEYTDKRGKVFEATHSLKSYPSLLENFSVIKDESKSTIKNCTISEYSSLTNYFVIPLNIATDIEPLKKEGKDANFMLEIDPDSIEGYSRAKFKWTTSDKSIATVVMGDLNGRSAVVSFTGKKKGTVMITVTSTDAAAVSKTFVFKILDSNPTLSSANIFKAAYNPYKVNKATFDIVCDDSIEYIEFEDSKLQTLLFPYLDDYKQEWVCAITDDSKISELKAYNNKKVNIKVLTNSGINKVLTGKLVIDTSLPVAKDFTVKQLDKLNLFYRYSETNYTVTSSKYEFVLNNLGDTYGEDHGYVMFGSDHDAYIFEDQIVQKSQSFALFTSINGVSADSLEDYKKNLNKITVCVEVDGYKDAYKTIMIPNVKVNQCMVAPKVTIAPICAKADNDGIAKDEMSIIIDGQSLYDENDVYNVTAQSLSPQNYMSVSKEDDGSFIIYNTSGKSCKYKASVSCFYWVKPVLASGRFNIVSTPELVSLNGNKFVLNTLDKNSLDTWILFAFKDSMEEVESLNYIYDKKNAILFENDYLIMDMFGGFVTFRINPDAEKPAGLKDGNYIFKFTGYGYNNWESKECKITLTITSKASTVTMKTTGNINTLERDNSYILLNPVFKNTGMNSKVEHIDILGDGNKNFYIEYIESEDMYGIKARENANLKLKETYVIELSVKASNGVTYELTGKNAIKFKVKQPSCKFMFSKLQIDVNSKNPNSDLTILPTEGYVDSNSCKVVKPVGFGENADVYSFETNGSLLVGVGCPIGSVKPGTYYINTTIWLRGMAVDSKPYTTKVKVVVK